MSIYIYTHKDFSLPVHNKEYKILTECKLNEKYDLELIDVTKNNSSMLFGASYGELKGLNYIYENGINDKYIGLVHYRRYFYFMDNVPDFNEIDNKTIYVRQRDLLPETVEEHYGTHHNIRDLSLMKNAISMVAPLYIEAMNTVLNRKYLYTCNMFIMNNESFINYYSWLRNILDYIDDILHLHNYSDVLNHEISEKIFIHEHDSTYQARMHGFIAERLLNIFIEKNFNNVIELKCNDLL